MTRLNDKLTEWAEDAPPLGDIADRALTRSRARRRRIWTRVVPVAAAAAVTAIAVVVAGIWSPWSGPSRDHGLPPVHRPELHQVQVPTKAPKPLPAKGVKPAVVGYRPSCQSATSKKQLQQCHGWRLVNADGTQWSVDDAYPDWGKFGRINVGALAVSPGGKRVSYIRKDRALVIRDLASGRVRTPLTVPKKVLTKTEIHLSWSPDGKWLSVDYSPVDDDHPTVEPGKLVNVKTLKLTKLEMNCCVLGLPDGARPVPLFSSYGPKDTRNRLWLQGRGRTSKVRINAASLSVYPFESNALISAGGRTLAAVLQDNSVPFDPKTFEPKKVIWRLQLINTRNGKVTEQHRLVPELGHKVRKGRRPTAPVLYGWQDPKDVFVGRGNSIYTINTRTGATHLTLRFSELPEAVQIATHLL